MQTGAAVVGTFFNPVVNEERVNLQMSEEKEAMGQGKYLLEMLDIEKQFPGVKALDHAKLQLRARSTPSWEKTEQENPP